MSIIPSASSNDTTTTVPDEDSHEAAVARYLATPYTDDFTPAPMTAERLIEIRLREEAATPGPWEEHLPYGDSFYAYLNGPYLRGVGTLEFGDGEDAEADRAFVLKARQDVPALLAEVDRLRRRVTELEAQQATVVALHRKHTDSEHCFADDEAWPCNTWSALAPATTPRDLRPGADAARRMIRDRQAAEDPHQVTEEQARRIERDHPETDTAHDCNISLSRRLDCGHCPHEVCQDCDRCPHACRCAKQATS